MTYKYVSMTENYVTMTRILETLTFGRVVATVKTSKGLGTFGHRCGYIGQGVMLPDTAHIPTQGRAVSL